MLEEAVDQVQSAHWCVQPPDTWRKVEETGADSRKEVAIIHHSLDIRSYSPSFLMVLSHFRWNHGMMNPRRLKNCIDGAPLQHLRQPIMLLEPVGDNEAVSVDSFNDYARYPSP